MKDIWLPNSETKVLTYPDGTIKIWDEIIMTKEPLAKKEYGFLNTTQLSKNNPDSSSGRTSGSGPENRGSNP